MKRKEIKRKSDIIDTRLQAIFEILMKRLDILESKIDSIGYKIYETLGTEEDTGNEEGRRNDNKKEEKKGFEATINE